MPGIWNTCDWNTCGCKPRLHWTGRIFIRINIRSFFVLMVVCTRCRSKIWSLVYTLWCDTFTVKVRCLCGRKTQQINNLVTNPERPESVLLKCRFCRLHVTVTWRTNNAQLVRFPRWTKICKFKRSTIWANIDGSRVNAKGIRTHFHFDNCPLSWKRWCLTKYLLSDIFCQTRMREFFLILSHQCIFSEKTIQYW